MKFAFLRFANVILFNLLKIFQVFNVREDHFLFISFDGKQISGCPLYLHDYIKKELSNRFVLTWVVRDVETHDHERYKLVRKGSFRFFYKIATAKYIITNDRINSFIPVRRNQVLVNTWHGGGLFKKTYSNSLGANEKKYVEWLVERDASRTSMYLASSKRWRKIVVEGTFKYQGKICNSGSPRNTIFFEGIANDVKRDLGIPKNHGIILFAPTYRNSLVHDFEKLDTDECIRLWEAKEGRKFHFLFRGHHNQSTIPVSGNYIDVTKFGDMQKLLNVSNIFVTDFSSALWDFSLTKKPAFIYAPDIDEFNSYNGFESDYLSWPFDIAYCNEGLLKNMKGFVYHKYLNDIEKYHESYGSFENSEATRKAVEAILSYANP